MHRQFALVLSSFVAVAAVVLAGCNSDNKNSSSSSSSSSSKMQAGGGQMASATIRPSKAAATQPANTNVTGNATFTQQGNDVHVVADLTGLSPGKHGFHIHDKADLSDPQLTSAGGHYNPTKAHHGGPDTPQHHAGDLGNLVADDSGNGHLDETIPNLKVSAIVGKSVIVHAKDDDLKTDPAGNSGGRVAGGVIEAAK